MFWRKKSANKVSEKQGSTNRGVPASDSPYWAHGSAKEDEGVIPASKAGAQAAMPTIRASQQAAAQIAPPAPPRQPSAAHAVPTPARYSAGSHQRHVDKHNGHQDQDWQRRQAQQTLPPEQRHRQPSMHNAMPEPQQQHAHPEQQQHPYTYPVHQTHGDSQIITEREEPQYHMGPQAAFPQLPPLMQPQQQSRQQQGHPHSGQQRAQQGGERRYVKGELVLYRQRDGSLVQATVKSVDESIVPPSYCIELLQDGELRQRETEGPRLQPLPQAIA